MLKTRIEQLLQIYHGAVWDGNLISKHERDMLVSLGLVEKSHGYNIITRKGIESLHNLDLLDRAAQLPREPVKSIQNDICSGCGKSSNELYCPECADIPPQGRSS